MFTPPPSPLKLGPDDTKRLPTPTLADKDVLEHPEPPPSPNELKRQIGRRIRFNVIFVPLVLILIGMSTRWITHPAVFDILAHSPSEDRWHQLKQGMSDWTIHKRHPSPAFQVAPAVVSTSPQSGAGSPSSTIPSSTVKNSPSGSPSATTTVPTIPASPPILPTPFPQPFDSSLQANFSNTGCYNFFLNMTNTQPFRSCRAFSLLLQSSGHFLNQSQSNLSAANAVQWGTCNTSINEDQCQKNMAWFATNLQSTCSADLGLRNTLAVNALQGLQVYSLMRKTGCLPNPSTNTYCYIEAAANSNPSDLYYYQLPLGIGVPTKAKPTCSSCSKGILALYAAALGNSSQAKSLGDGLKKTYDATAATANQYCGPGFAQTLNVSAGKRKFGVDVWALLGFVAATLALSS